MIYSSRANLQEKTYIPPTSTDKATSDETSSTTTTTTESNILSVSPYKSKYIFDPNATQYSVENAGFLLDASAAVYNNEDYCRQWAHDNNLSEKFYFLDSSKYNLISDIQCFVAQNSDLLLIVFRGTDKKKLQDFFTNLQGAQKKTWQPFGAIHEGFYDAFFSLWGKKFDNIKVFPDVLKAAEKRKIWITGHSLGGALAQICAVQMELVDNIPVQGVYTYGQPRIGNKKFATTINKKLGLRLYRVINDTDIIPTVAPYSLGYTHYGNAYYYDKDGKLIVKQINVETNQNVIESLEKSVPKLISSFGSLNSVNNLVQSLNIIENIEQSINLNKIMKTQKQQIIDHFIKSESGLEGYIPKLFKTRK